MRYLDDLPELVRDLEIVTAPTATTEDVVLGTHDQRTIWERLMRRPPRYLRETHVGGRVSISSMEIRGLGLRLGVKYSLTIDGVWYAGVYPYHFNVETNVYTCTVDHFEPNH